jgi:hypothetical protein
MLKTQRTQKRLWIGHTWLGIRIHIAGSCETGNELWVLRNASHFLTGSANVGFLTGTLLNGMISRNMISQLREPQFLSADPASLMF